MRKPARRGGKRRKWKTIYPNGGKGQPYQVEVIETHMKIAGRKHSTSYSIQRHGVAGANRLADQWLANKRKLAAAADRKRARS